MDALSEADGGPEGVTKATWKMIAKALADIREATPEVTPDEIRVRIANYKTHMPDCACTSTAVSKHWAKIKEPAEPRKPQGPCTSAQPVRRTYEEAMAMAQGDGQ